MFSQTLSVKQNDIERFFGATVAQLFQHVVAHITKQHKHQRKLFSSCQSSSTQSTVVACFAQQTVQLALKFVNFADQSRAVKQTRTNSVLETD